MKDVLCVEWVPAGTLIKALVGFFSLLGLCILSVTIAVGFALQHPFLIVVLASPLAFVLLVFWNYRGIRIKVTTKSLLIYYGFFNRKRILIGDIVSCEPTKASFRRYGGIGVRYGSDGSWAYTASLGDAVKIILRKGKPFVFSSNNPEKICSIIDQMKNACMPLSGENREGEHFVIRRPDGCRWNTHSSHNPSFRCHLTFLPTKSSLSHPNLTHECARLSSRLS